jgi:hypothetical protein
VRVTVLYPNPLNFLEPDSEVFQVDGGVCCHGAVGAVGCLAAHVRCGFVRGFVADWAIGRLQFQVVHASYCH